MAEVPLQPVPLERQSLLHGIAGDVRTIARALRTQPRRGLMVRLHVIADDLDRIAASPRPPTA